MKLTFIGTSHGVCEPNRKCSSCFLEIGGRFYVVDMGCDIMPDLINRGRKPSDITAIFITHPHGDHVNGLVPFTNQCSWCYTKIDPLILLPEMSIRDALSYYMETALHLPLRPSLRFEEYKEGCIYDDGILRVTAVSNGHMPNSYSLLFEADGKRVLFTGDLSNDVGPITDFARMNTGEPLDLAVVESVHFDPDLYTEPVRKNPPKRMFITHYSSYTMEKCCRFIEKMKNEVPMVLLTDGYEVTV